MVHCLRNPKKKTITAQSTAEAELVALNFAAREISWLLQLYEDMGNKMNYAVTINEDNQSAIQICENPMSNNTNKHMGIKNGFIKDELEQGKINIKYVSSKEQLADLFMKALSKCQFQKLRKQIGMSTMP